MNEINESDFFVASFDEALNKIVQKGFNKVERCPLKYVLVRELSCLIPERMVNGTELAKKRFGNCVATLMDAGRIETTEADRSIQQYSNFVTEYKDHLKTFKPSSERLNEFLSELLLDNDSYKELCKVVKALLLLSHGNARVESGFSTNEQLLQENLKEKSLISERLVYDVIQKHGKASQVPISQEMVKKVQNARHAFRDYQKQSDKLSSEEKDASEERKKKVLELTELEARNKRVVEEQVELEQNIKKLKKSVGLSK